MTKECFHGALTNSCETRERDAEIERLRSELAEAKKRVITDEQIDRAWEFRGVDAPEAAEDALAALGVVACEECGGGGLVKSETAPCHIECPACHGHGWRRED